MIISTMVVIGYIIHVYGKKENLYQMRKKLLS